MVDSKDGGTFPHRGWREVDMVEKNKESGAEMVLFAGLSDGIRAMVAEAVTAQMETLTKNITAQLPDLLAIPTIQSGEELHRLLRPSEVAKLLACTEDTVKRRMDNGEISYIVERGSDRRRIPYAWVIEYIYKHKRYTGPFGKRREVVENA